MNVEDYLDTVARSFDISIKESVNELKTDLLKACATFLSSKMKPIVEKNLSKFCLYAVRNIFKESPDSGVIAESNAAVNTSVVNAPSSSSSAANTADLDSEIAELDKTLDSLKRDYLNLPMDYSRITAECQDMDALIKDMRETSFSVRLRIQEMDQQMDQQSLADSTNLLNDNRARLQECSNEAEALIRKMNGGHYSPEESENEEYFSAAAPAAEPVPSTSEPVNTTEASVVASTNLSSQVVRTGPASSILRVAQSLQSAGTGSR
eukprot:gene27613-35642_t